ncbi:MAG: MFS transporter [Planctomycetota bacterium]
MPLNARLFIWFRVFFNARFYYPVLAVFFVDLGLTLDQYALLNVAWAASIVALELPLGAVADRFGRRPLIVGAAAIMVIEMAVMAFAPAGDPDLLFWVFFVNRLLSGLAEAAASGADEALAYDTLKNEGCADKWPVVLSRLQRRMSVGFMIAMVVGAAVYDPTLVNRVFGTDFDATTTLRFPVYLTLGLSLGALGIALRMTEPAPAEPKPPMTLRDSVRETLGAGKWILATPFALAVVVYGCLIDSPGRIVMTLVSTIYRWYGIPEAFYGVLGATLGLLGLISPTIATWLMRKLSPWGIYVVIVVLALGSLFGLAQGSAAVGIASMGLLGIGFNLLGFFTSHYLNLVAPSESRATILSFRSLAGNLSYGVFGWLYAVFFVWKAGGERPAPNSQLETDTLAGTLQWIPIVFLVLLVPVFIASRRVGRMCECEVRT